MFNKKQACPKCDSNIKADFDFCPHCGCDMRNPEKDARDFGLLGKNEFNNTPVVGGGNLGFSDKILQSIFNSLMKSLEGQMKNVSHEQDVQHLPNGIIVNVSTGKPQKRVAKKKTVSEEQIKRMTGLPRVEAKTDVRRLSDKVVYELKAPGIESIEDIFVSKVESGYEIKAIGQKKVYVNSVSVDLPLKAYSFNEKGVTLEFATQ